MVRIKDRASEWCEGLGAVTFSEGLRTIGEGAFNCCKSLRCIRFPESLRQIDIWGFMAVRVCVG
ncbi:MAG: leucine-rich repeat protein [Thermoguttaceae bacterium]|nr:leucine-rich repeat protein [Thermoguttaceae bacterium]